MMQIHINKYNNQSWDDFIASRPDATLYHRAAWADTLAHGADHQPYFLSAHENDEIIGVLPLCLIEGKLFGRFLVSLPHYLGGVCAATEEATDALLQRAMELANELRVNTLEIRGNAPLPCAEDRNFQSDLHKASFLVDLSPGEEAIWKGLRKQTRNRVRKGQQSEPTLEMGHHLLDEFWRIFSTNMQAIGSPTFSRQFFGAVLDSFGEDAQLLLARIKDRPVAAKLVLRHQQTLTMLWGATIPQEKAEGLNYYLTWEALRYALSQGCCTLDMGRSTIGSGPYQYKANWGGKELQHYWYIYSPNGAKPEMQAESPRFQLARRMWKKMPLAMTRKLGPWIAKQIP